MHVALEIANEAGIATVRWIFDRHPHVLSGHTIKQIFVNINVRILIVGKVIVNQCFAIDEFGASHPAREAFCDGSMMDPVFHVTTLPSMVSTFARLEPAGRVELICIPCRLQRHIKSIKLCFLGFERLFLLLFLSPTVSAEHPIVARTLHVRGVNFGRDCPSFFFGRNRAFGDCASFSGLNVLRPVVGAVDSPVVGPQFNADKENGGQ